MDIMILSADTLDAARAQIEAGLNKIASLIGPPPMRRHTKSSKSKRTSSMWSPDPSKADEVQLGTIGRSGPLPEGVKPSFAVVIDGDTLRYALNDQLKGMFLSLATQCETVVCCRVSPAQKAQTVKLVST